MQNSVKSNIWKLHLNTFLNDIMFFIPILVPFLKDFGFSMNQILISEAAYAITLVLLEVPSGYFADRYGRKTSIIIGALLNIVGFTLYAIFQNFSQFVVANIVIGLGYAFISGADSALLYESLEQIKQSKAFKKVQGTNFALGRTASVLSTLLGGWLVTLSPRLPFYLTIPSFILIFLISLTLHETKIHHEIHEGWGHFKEIVKDSLSINKKLRNFLLFTSVTGFFTLGFFLNQDYMAFIGLPLVYFGIVVALMNVSSGFFAHYAERIEAHIGRKLSLMAIPLLTVVAWLGMAFSNNFWILPLLLVSSAMWGFSTPIFAEFIHKITTKDRRATVMSIMSLLRRLAFTLFAPIIGYIADIFTIQEAFLIGAVILLLLSLVSLLSLRRVKLI